MKPIRIIYQNPGIKNLVTNSKASRKKLAFDPLGYNVFLGHGLQCGAHPDTYLLLSVIINIKGDIFKFKSSKNQ